MNIAVVGMACRYPDANNPQALWENVISKRRAFRKMPAERLNLADYFSSDKTTPDSVYCEHAAVIEGYEFDRVKYHISGNTYRSTDLTHWLALDVAAQALEDAGFPQGFSPENTGVLVGNTLTGEFSRSELMRLRWPYVRRVLNHELRDWSADKRAEFLAQLEINYKQAFPPVGEETLAGGLSNTIAGRICNYFDFGGGGYTLDGACSSSLVAVSNACNALILGDIDTAVVGGVDLSLDPFELVGFSKTQALASSEMLVYDANSNGFWPGEGCGFAVLMRYEDALANNLRCYAVIRGWGLSSDGSGGLTRPEVKGQSLALSRAYKKAGYGIDTVSLFEGHGTGTQMGDKVELQALTLARGQTKHHAALGSIKANIGHTKAASGIAGFLKTVLAVHQQVLPPTTGVKQPNPILHNNSLQLLSDAEIWPKSSPLRASASSFGFGGINAHVTIESVHHITRTKLVAKEKVVNSQDCELLLLDAENTTKLVSKLEKLREVVSCISFAELGDLAADLLTQLNQINPVRAALVAKSPSDLTAKLTVLINKLAESTQPFLNSQKGLFFNAELINPKITLLFSGQASPIRLNLGLWKQFSEIMPLYADIATVSNQAAIITAEVAGLKILNQFGIEAQSAIGHSLGELAALHWAGAMDRATLLEIVKVRSQLMDETAEGAMLSLATSSQAAQTFCDSIEGITIACFNNDNQTIVSGSQAGIKQLQQQTQAINSTYLPLARGFHSKLMLPAAQKFKAYLSSISFNPLQKEVISTVTGTPLDSQTNFLAPKLCLGVSAREALLPDSQSRALLARITKQSLVTSDSQINLNQLLVTQLTDPVLFMQAVELAIPYTDLFIEVGPGQVLTNITQQITDTPVVSLDVAADSLHNLLSSLGEIYALGGKFDYSQLMHNRLIRPFNYQSKFFVNPCELAPPLDTNQAFLDKLDHLEAGYKTVPAQSCEPCPAPNNATSLEANKPSELTQSDDILENLRILIAQSADLPTDSISDNSRLLSDLHLNSITVGQIVAEVSRKVGLSAPLDSTAYADSTLAEIAAAMQTRIDSGEIDSAPPEILAAGVENWIRTFKVDWLPDALSTQITTPKQAGQWQILGHNAELNKSLLTHLNTWGNTGVVLILPEKVDETHIEWLLESSKTALTNQPDYFVVVQYDMNCAALGRTFYQEHPDITTCVITLTNQTQQVENIVAEIQVASDYHEVWYDTQNTRHTHLLSLLPLADSQMSLPLTSEDILLVTGGGKGITAECAASLAKETGAQLILLGRSLVEKDSELQTNLNRLQQMGIKFSYFSTDITNEQAIQNTIQQITTEFGEITAILHGAGINQPALLHKLDNDAFQRTLAPKVAGLRYILAAIEPNKLKLLLNFGSIIATAGLPGEAHYALANEWLAHMTVEFQQAHLQCRCLTLEWSVWSEVGMGKKLGSDEVLARQGIMPISPEIGIKILQQVLKTENCPTTVVVSGRLPDILPREIPDLPFLRFLETPLVYYPGIELVVDANLSAINDPYLTEHVYAKQMLLPAVVSFEAMAQAAMAVLGTEKIPVFEDLKFSYPIVISDNETLRIAALAYDEHSVKVVLRCEQTQFQVNHFEALCVFKPMETQALSLPESTKRLNVPSLYGNLFFQQGRFQCVSGYQHIEAKQCIAELNDSEQPWFGRYLAPTLLLGNPGVRDATIHAIQVCTPHLQLLPVGMEKLHIFNPNVPRPLLMQAVERWQADDVYCYDLTVWGQHGEVKEVWQGLQLRRVSPIAWPQGWLTCLLASYVERKCQELLPDSSVKFGFYENTDSETAVKQLLGQQMTKRPDGKPELVDSVENVSITHADSFTFVVSSLNQVACDLEVITLRSMDTWQDLLNQQHTLISPLTEKLAEDEQQVATRLWTAKECLKKAGLDVNTPLFIQTVDTDNWLVLASEQVNIVSTIIKLQESDLALAILIRKSCTTNGGT